MFKVFYVKNRPLPPHKTKSLIKNKKRQEENKEKEISNILSVVNVTFKLC